MECGQDLAREYVLGVVAAREKGKKKGYALGKYKLTIWDVPPVLSITDDNNDVECKCSCDALRYCMFEFPRSHEV